MRDCDYYDDFENDKIVYIDAAKAHYFAIDVDKQYMMNDGWFISTGNAYLAAFLNSTLFMLYIRTKFPAFGDASEKGRPRLDRNKMLYVPIKPITEDQMSYFTEIVNQVCQNKALFHQSRKEFLDFIIADADIKKLSRKLKTLWILTDSDFLKEIKKLSSKAIPATQRQELLQQFKEKRVQLINLIRTFVKLESEIDETISDAYNLTSEEKIFLKEYRNQYR